MGYTMKNFTEIEQQILQIIQTDFPLTERPYQAIGKAIGISEDEVITILRSLKQQNIIRQISAIFLGTSLGFHSSLVSFQIQENHLDHAAKIISAHPGVSHNYQRKHLFNLWFTLSVPENLDIEQHVHTLAELTSCAHYLYLPSLRMFKRHVQLDMGDTLQNSEAISQISEVSPKMSSKITLPLEIQQKIMGALQKDLALSPTPFQDIAQRLHIEKKTFFSFLHSLKSSPKMSRFAGILKHRNLGFTANAMVVWKIPENTVLPFAEYANTYRSISHCYERVTDPRWPYNVYTMIHGKTHDATQKIIDELSAKFDMTCYEILYSGKEYKKQRVDFFSNKIDEWHKANVSRNSYENTT